MKAKLRDIIDEKVMMPGRRSRVSGLDAVRALAAAMVFICHSYAYMLGGAGLIWPLPQVMALGAHGVDLFIVVSGFCLGMPFFLRRQPNPAVFYRRRAVRILPTYYVAVGAASIIAAMNQTSALVVSEPASVSDVIKYLLGVQILGSSMGSINGSLWSVALELHLYILFPVTALLYRKFGGRRLILVAGLASVAWGMSSGDSFEFLGSPYLLPFRYVEFLVGMAIAEAWTSNGLPTARQAWTILLLGLAIAVVVSTAEVGPLVAVAWAVPSAGFIILLLLRNAAPRGLPTLEKYGKATYSFYLIHQPIQLLLGPMTLALTGISMWLFPVAVSIAFAITCTLSGLLYLGVERPTHKLSRRIGSSTDAKSLHQVTRQRDELDLRAGTSITP